VCAGGGLLHRLYKEKILQKKKGTKKNWGYERGPQKRPYNTNKRKKTSQTFEGMTPGKKKRKESRKKSFLLERRTGGLQKARAKRKKKKKRNGKRKTQTRGTLGKEAQEGTTENLKKKK